jgi:pimeloyl-ACP methyl ester carboxylesterase
MRDRPGSASLVARTDDETGAGVSTLEDIRRNVLLVHGAWHGAWCWEQLAAALRDEGWQVFTVDLPSASAAAGNDAGMYDDARVIREQLELIDGPVVVVAHSYGGLPATEAAAGAANVSQLIYVTAFQMERGESLATIAQAAGVPLPPAHNSTMAPPLDGPDPFYGGVPEVEADRARSRLVPQTVRSFHERLTSAAWKTIPSAYVVCELDRALPAAVQESMATRALSVDRLPAAHSPFLSMPTELARLITSAVITGAERR